MISKDTIVNNGYDLKIERYVNSSKEKEQWDIRSIMFGGIPKVEIEQLSKYWNAFPGIKEDVFESVSEKYMDVKCLDIKKTVTGHKASEAYKTKFVNAFDGFAKNLKIDLIDDILDVPVESEKEKISKELFSRIDKVPLMDRYNAYQILSDRWEIISADLEMIQTEGFNVINQVDPNMVVKKSDAKDSEIPEVQEGWKGHILSFDLVQREILTDDFDELTTLEDRLKEISSLYGDIIETMEEDEKDSSILNDSNDAFVSKEIKNTVAEILRDIGNEEISALKEYLKITKKKEKLSYIENTTSVRWKKMELGADGTYTKGSVSNRIKEIQLEYQFDDDSFESKMVTILQLMEEESLVKKAVKEKIEELHLKTKETIENMDEDTSLELLEHKWITPLINELSILTDEIIEDFANKIISLANKYCTTFSDVEEKIDTSGKKLSEMISKLHGNECDMEGLAEFRKILEV